MIGKFIFHELTATIADYMFYTDKQQEIDDWLELHNSKRMGMIINFADEKTKILFQLRWL